MPTNAFESLARAIAKYPDAEVTLQLAIEVWSEPAYVEEERTDYYVEESFPAAVNWASVQPVPRLRWRAHLSDASPCAPSPAMQNRNEGELVEIAASMERMRKTVSNIGVGIVIAIIIAALI